MDDIGLYVSMYGDDFETLVFKEKCDCSHVPAHAYLQWPMLRLGALQAKY